MGSVKVFEFFLHCASPGNCLTYIKHFVFHLKENEAAFKEASYSRRISQGITESWINYGKGSVLHN